MNRGREVGSGTAGSEGSGIEPEKRVSLPPNRSHEPRPEDGSPMAKPNYAFAKRQRDLDKKQKQEEKRQRKAEAKQEQPKEDASDQPAPSPGGETAGS